MGYNIGPKIGIDGEAEFRKQIRDINAQYKALEAETRAVTSAFEANGDEQGKLEATSKQLSKQIDNQKEKFKLLEDALAKAEAKYKPTSIEATRLRGALYDTQATIAGLESELADTNRKLDNLAEGMEEVTEETEGAGDAILDFGDILNANLAADLAREGLEELAELVGEFAKGSLDAAADVNAAGSQFSQTFGDMESTASASLERISDETDIAVTRIQGDYTKLYAFTKAAGADTESAMDIAGRAMLAAADNAAYYDKSIEDATEQLQSFLKGNYENDAALGIAATETTRNAKANEMYATSFDKLSESQKVDVLLAMVEAGNAASGALGQAAREAASWTNVQGELNEALTQLQATIGQPALKAVIPIIQDITTGIYDLIEKADWEKLDGSINDFVDSMEDADKQFEATSKETESAAYTAQWYVKRLKELEDAGLETADAQNEYAAIVKEVNDLIPDLNLTIDEQTGLVQQNTDALLADIQAWKDRAVAQAMQDKVTAQIQAQGQAEADLYAAKAALSALEAKEADLKRQLAEATGNAAQETSLFTQALQANTDAFLYSVDGSAGLVVANAGLTASMVNSRDGVAQLEKQLEQTQIEKAKLNDSIAAGEEALAAEGSELEDAQEAWNLYSEQTQSSAKDQDVLESKVQEVQQSLADLEVEYENAVAAARDSIDSQIGLFDELSTESKMTAQEIIANWQNQRSAFENYAANLQKAVDMGLDQALIRQLADGTEESMLYLDVLVNDTETHVEEINEAFRGVDEARDILSEELASVNTGAKEKMDELVAYADAWGYNIVSGAAKGVRDNSYIFEDAMAAMVSGGDRRVHAVLDMHSPSRVMEDNGENTVLGAVIGVEKNIKKFEASMARLASAGESAFLEERLQTAASYPVYMEAYSVSNTGQQRPSVSYGGFEINIIQQPGESAEYLAERVRDIIQTDIMRKEAALLAN